MKMLTKEEEYELQKQKRVRELQGKGFGITDAELLELRMLDPLAAHEMDKVMFPTPTKPLTEEMRKEIRRKERFIRSGDPAAESMKMELAKRKAELRLRGYDA